MIYTVYNLESGQAVRLITSSDDETARLQTCGDLSLSIISGWCLDSQYVSNGALVDRPEMALASSYAIGRGESLHLAIQSGAIVSVEGIGSETVGDAGFDFEAETPDTYRATVSLWPFLDATITIEVTP